MSVEDKDITIIGAGIGGLTAAIALAMVGANVRILEQASALQEVGAGLQLSPNGAFVLEALDMGPQLDAIGVVAEGIALVDGISGRTVYGLDLEAAGAGGKYRFIHRADLITVLAREALRLGVSLKPAHKVQRVTIRETGGGVVHMENGATEEASVVIGADGVNSAVRVALNGPATPFFTRQAAWRTIVPARGDELDFATVHMGPGRHLVTYPIREGREINVVGVKERSSWTGEGWNHEDDPQNMRDAFTDFSPEVTALLRRMDRVHLWGLHRHPVAERWHHNGVAILGDAAHPTLPFLAQGAVMAIEDAWVLADCLSKNDDVGQGLAAYQHRRHLRVERVVNTASRNARNYHLKFPPLKFAAHNAIKLAGRVAPKLALKKFDWLYGYDVTQEK